MGFNSFIKEFDKKHQATQVLFKGINIWPYLRFYELDVQHFKENRKVKVSSSHIGVVLSSLFYGVFNWFRAYDAVVFMVASDRRLVDGTWSCKTDRVAKHFKKVLFIEMPNTQNKKPVPAEVEYVSSSGILYLLEALLKFFLKFSKLQLASDINLQINSSQILNQFRARYLVTQFIVRNLKPKVAFVNAAYVDMPRVLALKEAGVTVIEMQHGNINEHHHGYQIYCPIHASLKPDFLFSFGLAEQEMFKHSNYIESECVVPVGSFYLEQISTKSSKSEVVNQLKEEGKIIVAVSGQDAYDKELIQFISEVGQTKNEIAFLYMPRSRGKSSLSAKFKLPSNMHFDDTLNVYEAMKLSDIHTTVNSTCALESIALGTPNLLFNFENKAHSYFSKIITDQSSTSYTSNPSDFVAFATKMASLTSTEVMAANENVFKPKFSENFDSAMEGINA